MAALPCIYVCLPHVSLWWSEEDIRSPRTGADGCEPLCGCWESNLGSSSPLCCRAISPPPPPPPHTQALIFIIDIWSFVHKTLILNAEIKQGNQTTWNLTVLCRLSLLGLPQNAPWVSWWGQGLYSGLVTHSVAWVPAATLSTSCSAEPTSAGCLQWCPRSWSDPKCDEVPRTGNL